MPSESLVVNSVTLPTTPNSWCWITNLTPEMVSASSLKGGDTERAHATGSLPFKRRVAATVKQFHMIVVGTVNSGGTVYSDQRTGVVTNVEYLTANLGLAYSTGAGTVTATWNRWDGSTKTAGVHVLAFETHAFGHASVEAVLELSIPNGAFS